MTSKGRDRTVDHYVVGIDGGGTKTTAKIVFDSGRPPIIIEEGSLNICSISKEQASDTIRLIADKIAMLAGPFHMCTGICIGVAGYSNPETVPFMKSSIERYTGCSNVKVTSDSYIAMCGALDSASGAILIAGTGSICYGVNDQGEMCRSGGAGHLIDDEGGGYAIGRDILSAVVRAMDGRNEDTVLTSMLKQHKGVENISDIVAFAYGENSGKSAIASIAPLLMDACNQKDQVAMSIANRAVQELFLLAASVIDKLALEEHDLAFRGSILQHMNCISDPLTSQLRLRYPELSIISKGGEAVDGAVYLAGQAGGFQ